MGIWEEIDGSIISNGSSADDSKDEKGKKEEEEEEKERKKPQRYYSFISPLGSIDQLTVGDVFILTFNAQCQAALQECLRNDIISRREGKVEGWNVHAKGEQSIETENKEKEKETKEKGMQEGETEADMRSSRRSVRRVSDT